MNVLSLCSGIGAFDLGLKRAGLTIVGQVECDTYCLRVLDYHFPEAVKHDDIRTCVDWWVGRDRPRVDVVAGGPPCQAVALPGRGLGESDERWLWGEFLAVVDHLRPEWVVWENVPGLRTRGLDGIHDTFVALGYRHTVGSISACALGAPHVRRRLLGVAHAPRLRRRTGRPWGPPREAPVRRHIPPQGVGSNAAVRASSEWASEPGVRRLVDGPPDELALRALGNAVVPSVGELAGRLITASRAPVGAEGGTPA